MIPFDYDFLQYIGATRISKCVKPMSLLDAIRDWNYARVDAILADLTEPLDGESAPWMLYFALNCSDEAGKAVFKKVLDHCPEPESFFFYPHSPDFSTSIGMVAAAAYYGRSDAVALLLDRGFSPNSRYGVSSLEAAIRGGDLACLKCLLEHKDLDKTLTDSLLQLFAQYGMVSNMATTLDYAAIPLLGEPFQHAGPVPSKITLPYIVKQQNLILLFGYCRSYFTNNKTLSREDSLYILNRIDWTYFVDFNGFSSFFLTFLVSTPTDFPSHKKVRYLIAANALLQEEDQFDVQKTLLNMCSAKKTVDLVWNLSDSIVWLGQDGILSKWNQKLGNHGLVPALSRHSPPPNWDTPLTPEDIKLLLSVCKIKGRAKKTQVSVLSIHVLRLADPDTLIEQLQPGGLLAQEDPQLLLEALDQGHAIPEENRKIIRKLLSPSISAKKS